MDPLDHDDRSGFETYRSNNDKMLWGLPFDCAGSDLVIIPVPWEVTVTFRTGTAEAPEAVLEASLHVDLHDDLYSGIWEKGIAMLAVPKDLKEKGGRLRSLAEKVMRRNAGVNLAREVEQGRKEINRGCAEMVGWVKARSKGLLQQGKLPAVLGGDHSCALGLIQALSDQSCEFGILQIDAHSDLRESYQGFPFSHASIMFNALQCRGVRKLVQVGIRDYSSEEVETASKNGARIHLVAGRSLWRRRFRGTSWGNLCREIVAHLPQHVYVSFDMDGLDVSLCPSSGTPSPGGLMFEEALFLIDEVVSSGRRIVAFDLSEVTPGVDLSDAYIGARLLYRLSCAVLASQ